MDTRQFLRALPGLILVAAGITALAFGREVTSCVADYDLTVCQVTGSAIAHVLGYALLVVGVIWAAWSLRLVRP